MRYAAGARRLASYRERIGRLRARMRRLRPRIEPEPVEDYVFTTSRGPVRLSQLFGARRDLFIVHNMGTQCAYCTLWADGYNGLYPHLASRAAFVVASPDPPAQQRRFARARGWRFPMVSHRGTTFAHDMGYATRDGGLRPGISAFRRQRGRLLRVSDAAWSPGDDFCALWHMLDLLPEGAAGWRPRVHYTRRSRPHRGNVTEDNR